MTPYSPRHIRAGNTRPGQGRFAWAGSTGSGIRTGPFATLIAVAATYCTLEAYDGAYDDLINRAQAPEPDDEEIRSIQGRTAASLRRPGPTARR